MSRRVPALRSKDTPHIPGFAEDFLPLTCLMPVQFRDLWVGSSHSPERELAAAVIEVAANDLRNNRYARRGARQRLFVKAYEWVTSESRDWPYSFVNLCESLHLKPEAVREQLLDLATAPVTSEAAEAA